MEMFKPFIKGNKPFSWLSEEDWFLLNSEVLDSLGIERVGAKEIINKEFNKRIGKYRIFPDTKKVLEEIKKMGYKIGLISNAGEKNAKSRRPIMEEDGILKYFDSIILSHELGYIKPHSVIFQHALDELGVQDPSKAIHIGDDPIADYKGAEDAGMIPIFFSPLGTGAEEWFTKDIIKIERISEIIDLIN
jgi:putative hydrolase of the HAD superfamily